MEYYKRKNAQAITEALLASLFVAKMIKKKSLKELGFDENGRYPTNKGDKNVPLLIPQSDGSYKWSFTKLPALCKDVHVVPTLNNDILIHKVKELRKSGTLQCRFIIFQSLLIPLQKEKSRLFQRYCYVSML
jgi:hypothetical protein